jgi:hypothetical protein
MPTVFRSGPYRFFFYSGDRDEPKHVHVERESMVAKFWLDPVRLAESGGFGRGEISRIHRMVVERRENIEEAWDEFFAG